MLGPQDRQTKIASEGMLVGNIPLKGTNIESLWAGRFQGAHLGTPPAPVRAHSTATTREHPGHYQHGLRGVAVSSFIGVGNAGSSHQHGGGPSRLSAAVAVAAPAPHLGSATAPDHTSISIVSFPGPARFRQDDPEPARPPAASSASQDEQSRSENGDDYEFCRPQGGKTHSGTVPPAKSADGAAYRFTAGGLTPAAGAVPPHSQTASPPLVGCPTPDQYPAKEYQDHPPNARHVVSDIRRGDLRETKRQERDATQHQRPADPLLPGAVDEPIHPSEKLEYALHTVDRTSPSACQGAVPRGFVPGRWPPPPTPSIPALRYAGSGTLCQAATRQLPATVTRVVVKRRSSCTRSPLTKAAEMCAMPVTIAAPS